MKIIVKNKFASIGGSSKVTDENGNDIFKVKGKFFSFTRKKKIYDMQGNLLYVVRNKFFKWWTKSAFIINSNKQKVARVKNRGIKVGFDVVGYGDEIAVNGWLMTGCKIIKNGKEIGSINTKFMSLMDTFEVDVLDGEDASFIVAMVIALDNITDRK